MIQNLDQPQYMHRKKSCRPATKILYAALKSLGAPPVGLPDC